MMVNGLALNMSMCHFWVFRTTRAGPDQFAALGKILAGATPTPPTHHKYKIKTYTCMQKSLFQKKNNFIQTSGFYCNLH